MRQLIGESSFIALEGALHYEFDRGKNYNKRVANFLNKTWISRKIQQRI